MDEVNRRRQSRSRGASVADVIDSIKENESDIEAMSVVVLYKDGGIQSAFTGDNTLELLGLAECLKDDVMKLINTE